MNPTLPGRIIEVYNEDANRIGVVEFDGKRRAIYLTQVPDAQAGDYVRFHAGFAIERTKGNDGQLPHQDPSGGPEKPNPGLETCRASRLLSDLDPEQLRKLLPLGTEPGARRRRLSFRRGTGLALFT